MNSARARLRLAVFAATSGHSGVDRNLKNLIPEFAARGIAVDVLHVRNHGPHFPEPPAGVRVIELGSAHVNTSLAAVVRYLRRERPDVLFADKDKVNRLALLARWLARVPTRVAVRLGIHVSTNLAYRGTWQRWIQTTSIRRFYPAAHRVLVPSQGVADDIARLGRLAPENIRVIPNPVVTPALLRLAAESVDHPWLSDTAVPVVLGVGELSLRKDFEMLIGAFALLRRRRRARLIILGRGKRRDSLLELARNLGVADDVHLPGFVDNPFAYMRGASVFANTSRFEGFANVVAEALAVGVPVVSTDCPSGPREILDNGRYGRLVPVADTDALARALEQTLTAPLARATLQAAAARYSIGNVADAYLDALGLTHGDRSAPPVV